MRRPASGPRRCAVALLILFGWSGAAAAREAYGSTAADLARANQRWKGARCRIRYDLEIKKDRNSEGWSRSRFMLLNEPGEKPFALLFEVSDRAALGAVLRGDSVPVGTEFVVEGWHLVRPDQERGLALDMRFADAPDVVARWWFVAQGNTTPEKFPLARLEQVERYMRIQAVALAAADERLVAAAPAAAATAAAASATAAAPAAGSPGPAAFKPALRLIAVAAQPAEVAAGDEIELVLTFEVGGLPPGAPFEVVERREIRSGEATVASFEQALARAAGTYTSSQRVRLPPAAAPGLYTLRARLTLAGTTAEGSALFGVR